MSALIDLASAVPAGSAPTCPPIVAFDEVDHLYAALGRVTLADNPRTAQLMRSSIRKLAQKVVEEAAEVALEAVRKRTDPTISESADLLYNLVVLWHRLGIRPQDVWTEMHQRAAMTGVAEKLPKRSGEGASGHSKDCGCFCDSRREDGATVTQPKQPPQSDRATASSSERG